jgi:sensor domain CHASE-containing protein
MIKFLEKIRQGLLAENGFSTYLIYAIGEIILVVIGILITFQINNLKEDRKRRKIEMASLNDISHKFITNKMKFERTLSTFVNQFELADSITR